MAKDDNPLAGFEDEETGILSAAEIASAVEEAKKKFSTDLKAKAKKELIAAEILKLQRVEGQRTGDGAKDEELPISIDLPEFANSVTVNMEPFWHGHTYTRPRHVVNSLREMIARAWGHQDDIDGKSMAQRLSRQRMKNFDKIEGQRV